MAMQEPLDDLLAQLRRGHRRGRQRPATVRLARLVGEVGPRLNEDDEEGIVDGLADAVRGGAPRSRRRARPSGRRPQRPQALARRSVPLRRCRAPAGGVAEDAQPVEAEGAAKRRSCRRSPTGRRLPGTVREHPVELLADL